VRGVNGPREIITDIDLRPGDTVIGSDRQTGISVFGMVKQAEAFASTLETRSRSRKCSVARAGSRRVPTGNAPCCCGPAITEMKASWGKGKVMQGRVQADTYVEPGDTIVALLATRSLFLVRSKPAGGFRFEPENPLNGHPLHRDGWRFFDNWRLRVMFS